MIKKLLALFLGIFLLLIVSEVGLRIIGFSDSFERTKIGNMDASAYRITCLGNSYTYGSGAPKKQGYPEQLESLLNQSRNKKYQVINRGFGNINTSFILENLPAWLSEDRPQIVFAMVGEPNSWNRYGYWNYLNKNQKTSKLEGPDFLRWSRTYRLIELLTRREESWSPESSEFYSNTFRGLKKNTESEKLILGYVWLGALEGSPTFTVSELSKSQLEEAKETLGVVFKKSANPIAATLLSEIHLYLKGTPDEIFSYLERAIESSAVFNYGQWRLAKSYTKISGDEFRKKAQELLEQIEKKEKNRTIREMENFFDNGVKIPFSDPKEKARFVLDVGKNYLGRTRAINDLFTFSSKYYPEESLQQMLKSTRLNPLSPSGSLAEDSEKIFQMRPDLKPKYAKALDHIFDQTGVEEIRDVLSNISSIQKWVISDLEKMIELSRAAGAKVIIQTYPPMRKGEDRMVDLWLRAWWKERKNHDGVEFLDVGESLGNYFKDKNKEDFYSMNFGPSDNHLNQNGYGLIARLMEPKIP